MHKVAAMLGTLSLVDALADRTSESPVHAMTQVVCQFVSMGSLSADPLLKPVPLLLIAIALFPQSETEFDKEEFAVSVRMLHRFQSPQETRVQDLLQFVVERVFCCSRPALFVFPFIRRY